MFDPYHKWLSIPPDQQPPTHYQLLGVAPDEVDPEVIDEAAIRQTAHVRTYQNGPWALECARLLNEIALARTTLLDPARRQAYDAGFRIGEDEPPVYLESADEPLDPLSELAGGDSPLVMYTRRSRRASARGIRVHNLVIFVLLNALSLGLMIWFFVFQTGDKPKHPTRPSNTTERQSSRQSSKQSGESPGMFDDTMLPPDGQQADGFGIRQRHTAANLDIPLPPGVGGHRPADSRLAPLKEFRDVVQDFA